MSLPSRVRQMLPGAPVSPAERPSRHQRREAGRERHQETGEPAWRKEDRLEDAPGPGTRDPDAAPEILGGV